MSKKVKAGMVLVGILGIPVFLYLILIPTDLTKAPPGLPKFFVDEVATSIALEEGRDTIYHVVPGYNYFSHDKKYHSSVLKGMVTVLHFPRLDSVDDINIALSALSRITKSYEGEKSLPQVITFLPLSLKVDPDKSLLSEEIAFGFNSMLLDQFFFNKPLSLKSGNVIFLVGANQQVRGIYDANEKEEIERLIREINVLYTQYNFYDKE